MTNFDTHLTVIKFRADTLSDAANLAYWMPDSAYHQNALADAIKSLHEALRDYEVARVEAARPKFEVTFRGETKKFIDVYAARRHADYLYRAYPNTMKPGEVVVIQIDADGTRWDIGMNDLSRERIKLEASA